MEYLNKIITKIVHDNINKYSNNLIFIETEYIVCEHKNRFIFYRSKSGYDKYKYIIDIYILDKLRSNNSIFNHRHKCKYCNEKGANFKLNCCKTPVHLNCALKYNLVCCEINKITKTSKEYEECSVCFEETNCKTLCNHSVCKKCLINIYKTNFKLECPYCRKLLLYREIQRIKTEMNVNYKKLIIPINLIYNRL